MKPAQSVRFVFERSTKGAHLYKEVNTDGVTLGMRECVVGALYVRRTTFSVPPAELEITITASEHSAVAA